MRLLFVVDGRSPIALNWINFFLARDYEVHLVSSYPGDFDHRFASISVLPVAFSNRVPDRRASNRRNYLNRLFIPISSTVALRTYLRQWLGPITLKSAAEKLSDLINEIKPDLIHAMRIPFEGMLLSLAETNVPRLISIWGNDFTLHAKSTPIMMKYTKQVIQQMNGLHADCHRDIRLAFQLGYKKTKPTIMLPGSGGVQLDLFYPAEPVTQTRKDYGGEETQTVEIEQGKKSRFRVINPRGFRAYVRNDVFFKSIPLVLEKIPEVEFFCPSMEDMPSAMKWVENLRISESVKLMPRLSRIQMADLYRECGIFVSPSIHDGTPNTLLEAMASGCFPVVGDIESIREWIEPEVNGILFQPLDPEALANAILTAINNEDLFYSAKTRNLKLIKEKAEYQTVMEQAEEFYRRLLYERN